MTFKFCLIFVHIHVCVTICHMCVCVWGRVSVEARRGCKISWSYQIWVLRTKFGFSDSAFNHWAIVPASFMAFAIYCQSILQKGLGDHSVGNSVCYISMRTWSQIHSIKPCKSQAWPLMLGTPVLGGGRDGVGTGGFWELADQRVYYK